MLILKVDLTKIDRSKAFAGKPRNDGTVPQYIDLIVYENDTADEFGNTHRVRQGASKEDRAKGVKMPFIGNGRVIGGATDARPATGGRY